MSDSANTADAASDRTAGQRATRRKWFPVIAILATFAAWIAIRQADITKDYKNVFTVVAFFVGAIVISIWFLRCGGYALRTRMAIVAVPWLALVLLAVLFKPIYTGDLDIAGWQWRFGPAADQLLDDAVAAGEAADWQTTPHDYPRFLGTGYWPEVTGVQIETDWQSHPPEEVWRQPIGAGWSAFAVVGDYAVTQEQRGDHELVTCYRVDDGSLLWTHRDATRFDPDGGPSFGGVGPRATPTVHDGRVFTQGATGIVNCLDARTGRVHWSHDTIAEQGAQMTQWGKSNSPLVVDDVVVISVGVGADGDSSLVAYDIESGDLRWAAGTRPAAYSSPVLTTIAGERQILAINQSYLTAHRADDGVVLWEHPWSRRSDSSDSTSQPVPLPGDRVFLSKGYGVGASLIQVARNDDDEWSVEPLWDPPIKPVMKTKMTNVVVRDGFVYGLDGGLLECIELESGDSQWKARRRPPIGHGQVLLVGDVLLVLTETGELLAVAVDPTEYRELASQQVLDDANVTWNNPALVPPYLLVRNGHEAACYRMPLAE